MCYKCQEILLPKSKSNNWNEASLEWTEGYSEPCDDKCICEHKITERYLIKNPITNKRFWLGSECIKNTFENNKDLIYFATTFYCPYCKKTLKRSGERQHCNSKTHINNLTFHQLINKECKSCKFYLVDKKNKTHHLCSTCFDKKVNVGNCKKCKQRKKLFKFNLCYKCHEITFDELLIDSDEE